MPKINPPREAEAPPPLWATANQAEPLPELPAKPNTPAKDLPPRRDVRFLGMLLGKVLVEQEGDRLFKIVEQLRRLFIEYREQPGHQGLTEAHKIISALTVDDAYRVTKAFAIYFDLPIWRKPTTANAAPAPPPPKAKARRR